MKQPNLFLPTAKLHSGLLAAFAACAAFSATAHATVYTYNHPSFSTATTYSVTADGQSIRVLAIDQKDSNGNATTQPICNFAFNGSAAVRVTPNFSWSTCVVKPAAYGIVPEKSGNTAVFNLANNTRGKVAVQFDGDKNKTLFVFADPPDSGAPSGAIIYGHGNHSGDINLSAGQKAYIAPGAVVYGNLNINGDDVEVSGRGYIVGKTDIRGHRAKISGITFTSTSAKWTVNVLGKGHATIDGIKTLYMHHESDGVSFNYAWNCVARNSFLTQGDDVFTPQGPDCKDNLIENVVVWKTGGNIFGTGVETNMGSGNAYRGVYVVNSECCNLLTSNWSNGFYNIPEMRFEKVIVDDSATIQSFIYFPGSNTGTRSFFFRDLLLPYAPSTVNTGGFTFTFENSYMDGNPLAHVSDLDISTASGNSFVFRTGWQLVSARDFNGDGKPDFVWRNQDSGQNHFWFLNGTNKTGTADTDSVSGNSWRMITTADMNSDGKPDIIWRNLSTGQNHVWFMNGTRKIGTADMESVSGTAWKMIAVADMNGDGKPDIIWRHPSAGQNHVWFMNGTTKTGTANMDWVYGRNWKMITVADMNGDGKPDVIWRNTATGQNHVWYMNGTSKTGTADMPYVAGTEWRMVAVADINRDGKNDIIWRHANTGQNHVWYMDGVSRIGTADFEWVTPVGR